MTATPVAAAESAPGPADDDGPATSARHFRWTRQVSGVTSDLRGVAWSGSLAVAVGEEGVMLSSADGVRWHAALQSVSDRYSAVAYGKGVFVAVGSNSHGTHAGRIIATSSDGVAWTMQAQPERMALTDVAFGDGMFVAVGNGGVIVRSPDGQDWQSVESGTTTQLTGVAYLDSQFVAIGSEGTWLTWKDGAQWTLSQQDAPTRFGRPVTGNGLTLAFGPLNAGEQGPDAQVWRSRDLGSWAAQDVAGCAQLARGGFAHGRFIVAGCGIRSTADGLSWDVEVAPTAAVGSVTDVTWTGSIWIAVGNDGAIYTGAAR